MTNDDLPAPVIGPASRPARPPTIKDIADRARVSKALVSMVMREVPGPSAQTRARVLQVAEELGYRANRTASMLARRRTKLLGVTMVVRSSFHAELVEDIQAAADEQGYDIVLSTVTRTHDERRAIDTLLEFRCEALLLLGPESATAALDALATQVPVVAVGRRLRLRTIDVVRADDREGMRRAVDHLVGLGHGRIAYLGAGAGVIATDRRRGYEKAMRRHGLQEEIRTLPADSDEEAGFRAAEALLGEERPPTAVVAHNDRTAIGLLDALTRSGVDVPKRVSVVGYDDSPVSRLAHINLTTLSQEPRQQATLAVQAAVERLDGGRATPRDVVLPPRLVVRGTTGSPPDD